MIGLFLSIFVFNFIAFKFAKKFTANQRVHIWVFTIAFQQTFDLIVKFKYHGYWFFTPTMDWIELLPYIVLLPPVNMMFLNWYPFTSSLFKKLMNVAGWLIAILLYELATTLPQPCGYFHYGWWRLWYSAIVDTLLFYILLKYYQWIRSLEERAKHEPI